MAEKITMNVTAKVNTIELYCKKCGADLTGYVPKEYDVNNESKPESDTFTQYDMVLKNVVCPDCGSNLMEAEVGLIIKNS